MSETKLREIALDFSECNGCTGCHELCPDVFGWDDDMERPVLLKHQVTPDEVQEAIACCPGECIYFVDED